MQNSSLLITAYILHSSRRVLLFTKTINFALPLVNVASACYSPLLYGFRRVTFTKFTSAFSSTLKMLAFIVGTEIQLFLNKTLCSFPHTKGYNVYSAAWRLFYILSIQTCGNIAYITQLSKWHDLRTLIEKVFRFFK